MQDKARDKRLPTYGVLVRYGQMRLLGTFQTFIEDLRVGERCVVKTDRGIEMGEMVCRLPDEKAGESKGRVLRRATPEDRETVRRLHETEEQEEYKYCLTAIRSRNLQMKLTNVEHLLGGERIIFYFTAPQRVDFRELVRDLARQYRTRIELFQIGVRDEAKLLADYEACGRPLCCKTYMRTMAPVSIKMAKNQKTTLDPAKLAGRCGRLKCCLRHEDAVYSEQRACLPKRGAVVQTADGPAEVVKTDILQLTVTVAAKESGTRRTVRAVEIKTDCNDCTRCCAEQP